MKPSPPAHTHTLLLAYCILQYMGYNCHTKVEILLLADSTRVSRARLAKWDCSDACLLKIKVGCDEDSQGQPRVSLCTPAHRVCPHTWTHTYTPMNERLNKCSSPTPNQTNRQTECKWIWKGCPGPKQPRHSHACSSTQFGQCWAFHQLQDAMTSHCVSQWCALIATSLRRILLPVYFSSSHFL